MDISIDIETLSLTNQALILSVGACVFDINTGKVKNSFYVSFEHKPTLIARFDVSQSTVDWWAKQSAEAHLALEKNRVDAENALRQLIAWIHQMSRYERSANNNRIWANDPQFDLANLGYAHYVYGQKVPWKFYEERSFRTIVDLAETLSGKSKDEFRVKPKTAHDALSDAIAQAETIAAAFNLLKGITNETNNSN